MKKKFRKQFHKQFPWYGQEYLLDAMILWTENASKMHSKHGNLVRSNDTSKKLKLITELLKRIREDNYDEPCEVFNNRNIVIHKQKDSSIYKDEIVYLDYKYQDARRKYDKEYCFGLIAKHLGTFWD